MTRRPCWMIAILLSEMKMREIPHPDDRLTRQLFYVKIPCLGACNNLVVFKVGNRHNGGLFNHPDRYRVQCRESYLNAGAPIRAKSAVIRHWNFSVCCCTIPIYSISTAIRFQSLFLSACLSHFCRFPGKFPSPRSGHFYSAAICPSRWHWYGSATH